MPPPRERGNYTSKEQELIAAFVLVAHSELEGYFERLVVKAAERAQKSWARKGRVCVLLARVLADMKVSEQESTTWSLDLKVKKSLELLRKKVGDNDGIKRNAIDYFLQVIGIQDISPYETLLSSLHSYGGRRGNLAHGESAQARKLLDPVTEANTIEQILYEIEKLDDVATILIRSI